MRIHKMVSNGARSIKKFLMYKRNFEKHKNYVQKYIVFLNKN